MSFGIVSVSCLELFASAAVRLLASGDDLRCGFVEGDSERETSLRTGFVC